MAGITVEFSPNLNYCGDKYNLRLAGLEVGQTTDDGGLVIRKKEKGSIWAPFIVVCNSHNRGMCESCKETDCNKKQGIK